MTEIIQAENVKKAYGPVHALIGASISVMQGEIVGLVGDNGAGKSTLVKVLSGVVAPDAGTIKYGGEERFLDGARQARLAGIETVHQDLGLCDNLRIYENIFLGRERLRRFGPFRLLDKGSMKREASSLLEESGVDISSVSTRTADLSGGQRQIVAISRAIKWRANLVLLDEPTAALSFGAAELVITRIENLRDSGSAVLMISHDIPHILRTCDRVVVMRHGRTVADLEAAQATGEQLVGLMTGAIDSPELDRSKSP